MLSIFRFNLRSLILLILLAIVLLTAFIFNLDDRYNIPRPQDIRLPDVPYFKPGFSPGQSRPPPPQLDPHFSGHGAEAGSIDSAIASAQAEPHHIDDLLRTADRDFEALLSRKTVGVPEAARAYREKRGRHPPPGFDQWVKFAEDVDATIIEDLFDQIYNDLGPFWGIPASQMKAAVDAWPYVISVRDGVVNHRTDRDRGVLNTWQNMVSQIAHLLPDLDMAVNEMDESRIFATWDTVNHYVNVGNEKKKEFPMGSFQTVTDYPKLPPPQYDADAYAHGMLRSTPIWSLVAAACPQGSPGRRLPSIRDIHVPPAFPGGFPEGSHHGYVSNWTVASDACMHPHLRGLHGTFIEPISISTSQRLFPIFSGSKLPQNNDILIPDIDFWNSRDTTEDELRQPWTKKSDTVFWRGSASGGRNRMPTWARFHRHRFVGTANGTALVAAQVDRAHGSYPAVFPELPRDTWIYNFQLPEPAEYGLTSMSNGHLGAWTAQHADVAFTDLVCFPAEGHGRCGYTNNFYHTTHYVNMRDHFNHKYLPDIDGNVGGTPRFPAALRSTSVPMKASIYTSWASTRVIPWRHYIPLDNTFKDFWGVMEYFLGYDDAALTSSSPLAQFTGFHTPPRAPKDFDPAKPDKHKDYLHALHQVDLESAAVAAFNTREWSSIHVPTAEAAAAAEQRAHGHAISAPRMSADEVSEVRQREADDKAEARALAKKVVPAHDAVGAWIAEGGARWAQRVLRKEDALVYVYRLLLEYARCSSEARDKMGFVADLQQEGARGLP